MSEDTTSPSAAVGVSGGQLVQLLADETRLALVRALRSSDRLVSELVAQTGLAQNLVSYHLGVLRQAGLVRQHRSDADGRASYYGLDLAQLRAAYVRLGADLALPAAVAGDGPPRTVVFLCRGNSARSQLAEGWLRQLSGGRYVVRSAGTQPGELHALAVEVMAEVGIDIGYQQAKHVDRLAGLRPDVVVTVCDIAREECPLWPAAVQLLHWSLPDPAAVPAGAVQAAAFRAVRDELRERVTGLLALG